jgi:hypothetical protein
MYVCMSNTMTAICRVLVKHDYRGEDVFACYKVLILKLAYRITLRPFTSF